MLERENYLDVEKEVFMSEDRDAGSFEISRHKDPELSQALHHDLSRFNSLVLAMIDSKIPLSKKMSM
jgi:hypothetical protein